MRVLMTVDAVGGVWNYAIDLANALGEHGVETLLALTGPPPEPAQRAAADACPGVSLVETGLGLDWLAPDRAAAAAAAARIAELAGDLGADVAHLNAPALAAARFAMPTVAVTHSCLATWWATSGEGALPADFAWRDALTHAGLHAAARVIAPSRAHALATMRAHALPSCPAVVHNGRVPLVARASGDPVDSAFTAGRLWDRGKDLATLDAAAALLDATFEAAGPLAGPQGETIALGHLRCLGLIDTRALAARLAQRPVFASAARYEPFGLAVLEAAQAGCALVLADIPVFRELWAGAARFVAPGDAAGFSRAIAAHLADAARRARAGAAAQARARSYTARAMAAGTAAIYRALRGDARAAA